MMSRPARCSTPSITPRPRPRSPPSARSSRCSTAPAARPIAGHATIAQGRLAFRGLIAKPDGSAAFETAREGAAADAAALGADAGRELKRPRRRRFLRAGVSRASAGDPARARRRAHRRGVARARPRRAGRAAAAGRGDRRCRSRRRPAMPASSSPAPMRRARSPRIRGAPSSLRLPAFAVGRRSAEAARAAGFGDVTSADGDARDLVRLIAARCAGTHAPLLYLAGEDRAVDIAAALGKHGVPVRTVVVYRTVAAAAFPIGRRDGARSAARSTACCISPAAAPRPISIAPRPPALRAAALAPMHYCLSPQVAAAADGGGRRQHPGRAPPRRGRAARSGAVGSGALITSSERPNCRRAAPVLWAKMLIRSANRRERR